jgi:hypothetical protein
VTTIADDTKPNGEVSRTKAKETKPEEPTVEGSPCRCGGGLVFERKLLCLAEVRSDRALQMRVHLNMETIREHANHYRRAQAGKLEEGERITKRRLRRGG